MTAKVTYFETLNQTAQDRYRNKLTLINDMDPYCISDDRFSKEDFVFPAVTYADIVNYLVYSPSPYTLEDLRCYKGLEAYNQYVNGWVRDVRAVVINSLHVVVGRVMHSQRLNEKPLSPWFIAEKCGKVLCAHCDCVAGLGETCTHISALLFCIETTARIRDSKTVTEEAAYWKHPTRDAGTKYLPISDIDFSSAKSKKRKLDAMITGSIQTPGKRQSREVPAPTSEELNTFFSKLSESGSKAGILRIVPGHSKNFVPSSLSEKFPTILTDLYRKEFCSLPLSSLILKCEEICTNLSVTAEQSVCVEEATRKQSKNKLWFRFRSGRITASLIRRVCHSKPDQPSQSLVKLICYPDSCTFTVDATKWGCEHEHTARNQYQERIQLLHDNFQVSVCGFIISCDLPFIGATPDAIISCDCCGTGVLEIKCPYCARDSTMADYVTDKARSCLTEDKSLKKDHTYMYQIQTQIYTCKADYADFVVWTNKDINIERIEPDQIMWDHIASSATIFFKKAVLPELVAKFYSKSGISASIEPLQSSESSNYCYCGKPEEFGDMIACDSDECKIEWFHIKCLKLKHIPKGQWYCYECTKSNVQSDK